MGNIVNLRQARKQKVRLDKREKSAESTTVSGIKKTERARVARLKDIADRTIDGHKREDDD